MWPLRLTGFCINLPGSALLVWLIWDLRFLQKHNNEKAEGANVSHRSIEILAEMSSWPLAFINLSVICNSPVYMYVYPLWLRDRKLPELRDKEITDERQAGKCSNTAPGPALTSTIQRRLARTETSTSIFRWHLHPHACDESRDKTYVSRGVTRKKQWRRWAQGCSGEAQVI